MDCPQLLPGCSDKIGHASRHSPRFAPERRDSRFQEYELEQFIAFLQKNPYHLVLFGIAVVSGGLLIWPFFGRALHPGRQVSALEAVQLINRRDAVVLDVREAADYGTGHITNARNVPEGQLANRIKELERYKSRPIILSCGTGARSARAGALLQKAGFAEVFTLRGGIAAWQQASMPLEK